MRLALFTSLLVLASSGFANLADAGLSTKGHWSLSLAGKDFAQMAVVLKGPAVNEKLPGSASGLGSIIISLSIDPCGPGCIIDPAFQMPTSVGVGITGHFTGELSSTVLSAVPLDYVAYAEAGYSGPGTLTFASESLRITGVSPIDQTRTTVANLGVGGHAFNLSLNGYAYLPLALAEDTSAVNALVKLSAQIAPGQESFIVPCITVPEPTLCAIMSIVGSVAIAARQRRRRVKPLLSKVVDDKSANSR